MESAHRDYGRQRMKKRQEQEERMQQLMRALNRRGWHNLFVHSRI
jgi:uncharacterized membrane protein YdjX (TVP38/TMEM64 family)